MDAIGNLISLLDKIVWSDIIVAVIIGASIYFTFRLRFVQIRSFKQMLKACIGGGESESGVSSLQAFWLAVGTRVGVGNIAGVATALYLGGPGSIFWMWVTAILLSVTSLVECSLAQLYKVKVDDEYRGGAMYCAEKGLGLKWLANIFALVIAFNMTFLIPGVQANTISQAMHNALSVPQWAIGLVGALLLAIIIFGGTKRIGKIVNFLVPIKVGGYFILTFIVLFLNYQRIPVVFGWIFSAAFSQGAVFGGIIGAAITNGVRRATFATGAGMGEQPPAAAAAESAHPMNEGLSNAFGIFINIIVLTCSALLMLVTDTFNVAEKYVGSGTAKMQDFYHTGQYGIGFIQESVNTVFPNLGRILVAVLIFLFAFTAVIGYSYNEETALTYLLAKKSVALRKKFLLTSKLLLVGMYFFFSIASSTIAWDAADLGAGLMVWINTVIIILLFPKVVLMLRDYEQQLKKGKVPYFDPEKVGIKNVDLWKEINKKKIAEEQ